MCAGACCMSSNTAKNRLEWRNKIHAANPTQSGQGLDDDGGHRNVWFLKCGECLRWDTNVAPIRKGILMQHIFQTFRYRCIKNMYFEIIQFAGIKRENTLYLQIGLSTQLKLGNTNDCLALSSYLQIGLIVRLLKKRDF